MIGRERETAEARAALAQPAVHLLTLVGPPGIGKTRLALEVANMLLEEFADGVFFVPLASLRDPGLVADVIAHTIGARETGNQTALQGLKTALRTQQLLLVLDNFEHLLAAAPVGAELLSASA